MTLPDSSEELELLLTSGMTEVYAGVGGFLAPVNLEFAWQSPEDDF